MTDSVEKEKEKEVISKFLGRGRKVEWTLRGRVESLCVNTFKISQRIYKTI